MVTHASAPRLFRIYSAFSPRLFRVYSAFIPHLQRLVKVFSTEIGRLYKVLFSSVRDFGRFVVHFVNLETVIKIWTVAVYVTQANTPRVC